MQARAAKTRKMLEQAQVELTRMRHGPGRDNTPPEVVETTRADGLWPFLLLRTIKGDYGARPMSQQRIDNINSGKDRSPDIIIVPAGPAAEPRIIERSGIDALWARRVSSMEFAAAYDIWVHVWNLGQTPASGVRVRVRLMPTGTFVGGTLIDLGDRLSSTAHRVVKAATFSAGIDGHMEPMLVATAECLSDVASGDLGPGMDRHTAHRLTGVYIPS